MSWILALLILLLAVAWLWYDTIGAGDRARSVCGEACRRQGLQLLDDSVGLQGMRLTRNSAGRLRIRRLYRFDFSDTGMERRRGLMALSGSAPEWLQLERDGGWEYVPLQTRPNSGGWQ